MCVAGKGGGHWAKSMFLGFYNQFTSMLLVVVVNTGDNYDNAYASHHFLFMKGTLSMAFPEKKKKRYKRFLTLTIGDKVSILPCE